MKEISKEYAQALFELGCESGDEAMLMRELDSIRVLFEQAPDYMALVSSPAVPLGERLAALGESLEGNFTEYAVSFVLLLCEKGHMRSLFDCIEEYRRLLDAKNARTVAHVTSARELTEEQKQRLVERLERTSGAKVTLECEIDPSLLGGAIVHMDGRIMDGSVRRRLLEIKEVMNT